MSNPESWRTCLLEYQEWLPASVRGITLDSRNVQPGDVFVACCGQAAHGLNYAAEAVARGAAVVLYEPECHGRKIENESLAVPCVAIDGLSGRLPALASCFYGEPSAQIHVTGITGTNGKSSIAWLATQALRKLERPAGLLGTLGQDTGHGLSETLNTTPDVLSVNRFLSQCVDVRLDAALMEISSHALIQGRVKGVQVKTAVFTNLSRDHLDTHGDMEAYGAAKAQLLNQPGLEQVWLNADDAWCRGLVERVPEKLEVKWYGCGESLEAKNADVIGRQVQLLGDGLSFELEIGGEQFAIHAPLIGQFNVPNLLAVAGILQSHGLGNSEIASALSRVMPVPGRMQALNTGEKSAQVILDFSHTPDGLEQALKQLKAHTEGKVWCVFGCGGGRDPGKRPMMGAVAEALADEVVITSDNPRYEKFEEIALDITSGMKNWHLVPQIDDRRLAINEVLSQSLPEDSILLAGKGHETYQEIKGVKHPYSDAAVVEEWLECAE